MKMGRFDKYSDLFADHGRFDIPANWVIGLAWKPNPKSALGFDVQRILYGEEGAVGNPFGNLLQGASQGDPSKLFGGSNGAGFGWRNMTVYKLGYQWEAAPGWTLRGGISYGRQPISSSDVLPNLLAPGVEEIHLTGGFTHRISPRDEVSLALMYAPNKSVSGPNPMEAPGQQTVSFKMRELALEAGWSRKF
jgi:long-chain fatty acid transport protein